MTHGDFLVRPQSGYCEELGYDADGKMQIRRPDGSRDLLNRPAMRHLGQGFPSKHGRWFYMRLANGQIFAVDSAVPLVRTNTPTAEDAQQAYAKIILDAEVGQ